MPTPQQPPGPPDERQACGHHRGKGKQDKSSSGKPLEPLDRHTLDLYTERTLLELGQVGRERSQISAAAGQPDIHTAPGLGQRLQVVFVEASDNRLARLRVELDLGLAARRRRVEKGSTRRCTRSGRKDCYPL